MIRARLRRLVEGIDRYVGRREGRPDLLSRAIVRAWRPFGRRVSDAQYRSDAAAWTDLRNTVDAELRQQDATWQGYTAGLTEAQIQAKIAADPAFVGAEQIANEAIHNLLRGRGDSREWNIAATAVVDREREPTARPREGSSRRTTGGGTRRDRPRPDSDDDPDEVDDRAGGGVTAFASSPPDFLRAFAWREHSTGWAIPCPDQHGSSGFAVLVRPDERAGTG